MSERLSERDQFKNKIFNSLGGCIIKESTCETIADWHLAEVKRIISRIEQVLYADKTMFGDIPNDYAKVETIKMIIDDIKRAGGE